jgi:CelD/BcsL family acetyltransferase involved in cellulose biosynthesis
VTYCYLQGFDPEFRDFSPGAQLVGAVIEDAIREQKRAVDFLRGAESYKYAWGARDQITFRLQASRRALPVRAA